MNNNIYVGIDIGKNGAIAAIHDGKIVTWSMPKIKTELDYHELSRILSRMCSDSEKPHIVFEKLGVILGSSKQTAFSMGNQAGAVEMMCICQGIPYTKVNSKDWQKTMFQGVEEISRPSKTGKTSVRDTKAMALVAIKRLFPDLKLTFGEKATKPHDGLIDAVLLAEYARRNNL